jgi:predicted transcriptional regulator
MADNIKNILQTINTKYDCDISESTLRRYLHKLEQTKYIQKTKLGEKTYYYFKMGDDDI